MMIFRLRLQQSQDNRKGTYPFVFCKGAGSQIRELVQNSAYAAVGGTAYHEFQPV
jgi:hypothetical protein